MICSRSGEKCTDWSWLSALPLRLPGLMPMRQGGSSGSHTLTFVNLTMDFFAHQELARRKTKVLVFYFGLAVVLMIGAIYVACVPVSAGARRGPPEPAFLWNPQLPLRRRRDARGHHHRQSDQDRGTRQRRECGRDFAGRTASESPDA